MCSARAPAKRRSIATGEERPRGLCRQRSRRQQHQLGRRDAAPGDARSQHPGDADEQPGAAHRHRRQSRTMSREAQRLVAGLCRRASTQVRQPPSLGDAAAGDAQGPHRRDQPLDAQEDAASTCSTATATGGFSSASARAIRARSTSPDRPNRSPASRQTIPSTIGQQLVGGTTLACSAHILGRRSDTRLLQTTASSRSLAEPNLTALSGETASFLAGGEFPIPV